MSAIAGIYYTEEKIPLNLGQRMMQALGKFPADDVKMWNKENVFLGCHAQWITPESIGEPLPYYDYDRQLVITSDAMIDNREELFDRLGVQRREDRLMPDSQLLILAYSKWGEEFPKQLVGDFAFMIWDERKQKLFGARDFSGARTLYYYNDVQRFAFCTVIEPLLKLPYIKKQLNEEWLAEYLSIPNMIDSVDVRKTVLKDILQVPPSHTITVTNGKVKLSKFNILSFDREIRFKNDEEYIEAFRDIFQKSVDSKLRTFKSVGSQLSGGLDSGSVVSFASRTLQKQNKTLHTYSSIPVESFNDYTPRHQVPDERPFIGATVEYVGNIEDQYLSLEGKNPYSNIDDWLEIMEMPYKFFENSHWIKGIFEQASKDGMGILLSGARGNFTISWGPGLDYYSYLLKNMKWIRFVREFQSYSRTMGVGRSKLLSVISKRAIPSLSKSGDYQFPMLINPDFAKETSIYNKLQDYGMAEDGRFPDLSLSREQKYFLDNEFVWNANGTSFSKFSLQYGVLMRDPTNDIRVINYCLSLPLEQFFNNGMDRALIRNATEGYLPDKVRLNQYFRGVQGADWVHRMGGNWLDLIDEAKQMLSDKDINSFLNIETLRKAISKEMEGPEGNVVPSPEIRILMRSIIVYRFLKSISLKGGDTYEKGMESANTTIIGY
ncbi:asparagine synthetase B [Robertmurraya yapensis]|uniref:asparagine synthase (glutamine-hydrolyzing) n=2 Tax=Bacillaceae TaxID=186817 RepID=A0A431W3F6_9BACI|nr:asparagine synthase-related protein [Bacillus yapensis]RTR29989.1 asparagine synthetase B [Bacillus yapensis]TKS95070.1 asparagine synthetase B [Bacillus yapensis]